jgi:hypothetical protein
MVRVLNIFLLALLTTPLRAQEMTNAPLPPVAELLQDVERNEQAAEIARRDYTYHLHKETQDLDRNGAVKKTETEDAESLRIDGVLVNRVTARNGKPLTPEEAQKESDRIDKDVAKDKDKRAKLASEGKQTDADGHQELSVARILQLGTFSNERRVMRNGRPTIVVDYAGDPAAKTRDRFETIVRDLVGVVWIDEADRTIAQLQGHFLNDFKIGGGLIADVKKDSSFSASFARINGEVWLPAEYAGQGKVRILLFTGFDGRMKTVASDYRKFRATATILPTNHEVGASDPPQ